MHEGFLLCTPSPAFIVCRFFGDCHSDWFEVMPHCRFLKINLFIFYFWLCWVFIAVHRLSLVAASGGLLFVEVRGLLTAVASLVVEHVL